MRFTLPTHLTLETNQKDVVNAVEELKFHWSRSVLSVNIDDNMSVNELLHDVVGLWLNIRSFSITRTWAEQISSIRTKSGLRKGLKKTSENKTSKTKTSSTSKNKIPAKKA